VICFLLRFCWLVSFQGKYRNWAKSVKFISKLPGDIKKRKEAAEQATQTLDQDLVKKKLSAHVILYTDKSFRHATVEWLVATDQVNCSHLVLISDTYILHFIAYTCSSTPQVSRNG